MLLINLPLVEPLGDFQPDKPTLTQPSPTNFLPLWSLQVATGLLALVAVIHFAITVVLTVLVVWVRCYCKLRGSVVSAKQPEDRRTSTDTERGI